MKGGTSGKSIVVGKGAESLLVHRLKGLGDEERMPLKKEALSAEQIALFERWIDEGADWPASADDPSAKVLKHWSFVKPTRPTEPVVKDGGWGRNPIDRFVWARLEKEGLAPSPMAAKETLLRRLSLDLVGLPPTLEELDAFLADGSPDAYEKQVERLLASPHYGERWGRKWLDNARYADSNGYSIDAPRVMWPWRDWVIKALNADMPFDRFTIEQLAGDLLPNATIDQKVATGFHRNTQINEEGGIDPEQFRIEGIIDRVATTSTVFLGLTMGCAQCHNHKFDPIAQKEYYQFFAFLNNADEPKLNLADGSETEAKDKKKDAVTALVLQERKQPRESHVFIKGDFTRLGDVVTPGVPAMLHALKASPGRMPNRLDLAQWIVDPENPLTARVTVNRIWQEYFGRGIVETENDFGSQGAPPTNPELLDWLATEFMQHGWSMKHVHRLIVTSATYRQSSNVRPELLNRDPYNKLLARQSRLRLDAELVRDVGLCASGLLADKVGGPSVFPPQPEGVTSLGQVKRVWKVSPGADRYRRGLYTFVYRATPHPLLTSFDAADGFSACTRRIRSNTPLQALQLLNDEASLEFAQALAARVMKEDPGGDSERIDRAFRLAAARKPSEDERAILLRLLENQSRAFAQAPAEAQRLMKRPTDFKPWIDGPADQFAAWVIVCRTLLNIDESITRE